MSEEIGGSSGARDHVLCPHCMEQCRDTRQLFRHVQEVRPGRDQSCLKAMNKTLPEFKADVRRQRETAWVRDQIHKSFMYLSSEKVSADSAKDSEKSNGGKICCFATEL